MSDSPIKFPSSPSSSEDDLPTHQSSDDWRPSNYSPPWRSEKEDEDDEDDEDEDDTNADVDAIADAKDNDDDFDDSDSDDSDSNSNLASPPPK